MPSDDDAVRGLQALDLLTVVGSLLSKGQLGSLGEPTREAARRVEVLGAILDVVAPAPTGGRAG